MLTINYHFYTRTYWTGSWTWCWRLSSFSSSFSAPGRRWKCVWWKLKETMCYHSKTMCSYSKAKCCHSETWKKETMCKKERKKERKKQWFIVKVGSSLVVWGVRLLPVKMCARNAWKCYHSSALLNSSRFHCWRLQELTYLLIRAEVNAVLRIR